MFPGLAGAMSQRARNKQALQASIHVFLNMMVARYASNALLNTFGISMPGLRMVDGD